MNGYKQMIRDRMPQMLNLALIYNKAKSRWIDYVYENIVKKYPKDKRSVVVKTILGIKQKYTRQEIYDHVRYVDLKPITKEQVNSIPKSELYMTFKDTIDFETLKRDDIDVYNYWNCIADWVEWFSKMYSKIEDTYKHAKKWKLSNHEIKVILMDKYGIDNKLVEYLIKTF